MQANILDGLRTNYWDVAVRYGQSFTTALTGLGPWFFLGLFIATSFLMIWRLNALERQGLEGTVLGTLIMPYASGFSNLMFAYILGRSGGSGTLVLENCLVNNVTNLTLLIGLPALLWSLTLFPEKGRPGSAKVAFRAHRLNYLSLLLTLLAALFFTGILWALSRDGMLDFGDGLVLVGIFLFWQVFHLFDVLKQNVYRGRRLHWSMVLDVILVIAGGICVYQAIDHLVAWIPRTGSGFLVFDNLGWLSGLVMTLPNAFLALYYAWGKRADIVYSSQVGDSHICIPLCIGLFALFGRIQIPSYFDLGITILLAAGVTHFFCISVWGRLPRPIGLAFAAAYGFFLYQGIIR
ncbi:MAG: sodium:calcium symporter [Desulfobacteraceae bacterium]|nr:MAG: sodium:calcium symporter [Desulfobacteraceae bacterium]